MRNPNETNVDSTSIIRLPAFDRDITIEDIKKIIRSACAQVVSDGYAFKIFFFLPFFLNRLHSDSDHAAANGLILSTLNLLYIPAVAPLFGISPDVSGWFGELHSAQTESDKEMIRLKVRSAFRNGCIYTFLIATPAVMLPLIFSEQLLISLGQNANVSRISAQFLRNYANTIPPCTFTFFAGQFFIAGEKTKVMLIGSGILAFNLLLSAGFGFGLWGLPKWDVNGILVFYSVDAWLNALLYAGTLFFDADFTEFKFLNHMFDSLKGNAAEFLRFLQSGSAPMVTILSEFGLMFSLTALSIRFGVDAQAAFSLATQCLSLNTIFNVNFAVAGMCILGKTNGMLANENLQKRQQLFWTGLSSIIISTLAAIPLPLLFYAYPQTTINLFSNEKNSNIIDGVSAIAGVIAIESVLKGPNYQLLFQTRVLQDAFRSTIAFTASMLLGLLVALTFTYGFKKKNDGLAMGFASAMFFTNTLLSLLWKSSIWNIIEKKEPADSSCLQTISNLVTASKNSLYKKLTVARRLVFGTGTPEPIASTLAMG